MGLCGERERERERKNKIDFFEQSIRQIWGFAEREGERVKIKMIFEKCQLIVYTHRPRYM